MKLTEHFTLEELVQSDTALRLGIDNTPPPGVVPHLGALARGLEQIRAITLHPLFVHSGFRCEALERLLCEKDFAAWCARHAKNRATAWGEYFERKVHPMGYAADFTCPAFGPPIEIVRALKDSGIKFDQLIEEGTWVHAGFDPRLRGEILTARFDKDGTPTYTHGVA